MKKQSFNLVEIIISMGIALVCITTIMGMFAVGMQMSDDAVMRSYSNNIVEQLAGFAETHPIATASGAIPDSNPSEVPDSSPPRLKSWSTIKTDEEACNTVVDTEDSFLKNVYMDGSSVGLLKVEYQTTVNATEVVDFTAMVRIWLENSGGRDINTSHDIDHSNNSDGLGGTDDDGDGKVALDSNRKLNIEVSWPHKIPYANRILSGDYILFQKVLKP